MRILVSAFIVLTLAIVPVAAQGPAAEHPYGLDPYSPSDAQLLRNYGAALVAQTPLLELQKLDPYKPSDAALLRQIGGAIPVWGLPVGFGPLTPFPAGRPRARKPGGLNMTAPSPSAPASDAVRVPASLAPTERPVQLTMPVCTLRMGDQVFSCL